MHIAAVGSIGRHRTVRSHRMGMPFRKEVYDCLAWVRLVLRLVVIGWRTSTFKCCPPSRHVMTVRHVPTVSLDPSRKSGQRWEVAAQQPILGGQSTVQPIRTATFSEWHARLSEPDWLPRFYPTAMSTFATRTVSPYMILIKQDGTGHR